MKMKTIILFCYISLMIITFVNSETCSECIKNNLLENIPYITCAKLYVENINTLHLQIQDLWFKFNQTFYQ